MDDGGEERPITPVRLVFTSLSKDGYFHLDGTRGEMPYPQFDIDDFERFSAKQGGKQLGAGQKLILEDVAIGREVTFGRNAAINTVGIGFDIIRHPEMPDGWSTSMDRGVSRTHFGITRTDKGWEVADKGSTSGTAVWRKEGELIKLEDQAEPVVLHDGDSILIDGALVQGSIHVFRFHSSDIEKPYLVKGVAANKDELAADLGFYERNPDMVGRVPDGEFRDNAEKEFDPIISQLVRLQSEAAACLENNDYPGHNKATLTFYLNLFMFVSDRTEKNDQERFMWTQQLYYLRHIISRRRMRLGDQGNEAEIKTLDAVYDKIGMLEKTNDPDVVSGKTPDIL